MVNIRTANANILLTQDIQGVQLQMYSVIPSGALLPLLWKSIKPVFQTPVFKVLEIAAVALKGVGRIGTFQLFNFNLPVDGLHFDLLLRVNHV